MKKKSRASIVEVQSKLAKVGTDVIVPDAVADNGAANEAETTVSGTTNGNGNLNGDHEEEDMDTTTSSSLALNGNSSMTQLLTHTVAHSTRPFFRPKTNNQPTKKFLSFAVT